MIQSIRVAEGHSLSIETCSWNDYWGVADALAVELEHLKAAWTGFVDSRFLVERRAAYVQAYFALLHACLERFSHSEIDLEFVKKVAAFETFHLSGQQGTLLAGIFNVRNPAYLLSRLAQPNSMDNPKYLPLVCPQVQTADAIALYCHYRRIPILGPDGIQLFVYPPVEPRDRPSSYSLLGQLFASLTPGSDPWVRERSQSLFNGVFGELVARSAAERIQLLDIACGSAKTTMSLCKKAFTDYRKSFDLTLVDVVRGNRSIVKAFLHNPSIFGNVVFRRNSLFDWVNKTSNNTPKHFDVVLMLRVCDVFSHFSVARISRHEASRLLCQDEPTRPLDSTVLRPHQLIEENRLDRIEHTIQRLTFRRGIAFRQFSLSPYFRAIHRMVGGQIAGEEDGVYLPVRRFDDQALVLPNGQSLIGQLMTLADRMIIEDIDLSPRRLQEHIARFGLESLRITDVTGQTKMRGASVCLIDKRSG